MSAWNASGCVTVHGLVYAFGSSIVIWMSRFPKSLRMNRSVILVGGEINPPIAKNQRLFQFGKQKHASAGRIQGSGEQPVITPRIRAAERSTGKAAQPVGLKPFPAEACLQIGTDALVKANHVDAFRSERCDSVENP